MLIFSQMFFCLFLHQGRHGVTPSRVEGERKAFGGRDISHLFGNKMTLSRKRQGTGHGTGDKARPRQIMKLILNKQQYSIVIVGWNTISFFKRDYNSIIVSYGTMIIL